MNSAPHSTTKQNPEEFRDHIATVNDEGKRVWIYPKKPRGRFYSGRTIISIALLAIFFSGPFITINGHPFLLLNFAERKFYILGVVFWPQDFHLFGLAFITLIVFIVLFTAAFGRVFCGWVCPQTVFMEMVFRKIEYWIEGDAREQRKLSRAPWTVKKVFKKITKHSVFYGISFVVGNTFLAYFIGKDELFRVITDPFREHPGGLLAMVVFSFVFYGVFAWFREQACIMVCPYGRLQGVLLDENSIVVHYDFVRGEPRGKGKRTPGSRLGDCIDCNQCVEVCPTGIDIRNGTQLECVNCTACMDACDNIMKKINKPKGLIRYASYNSIKQGRSKLINPRVIGYSAVLVVLVGLLSFLLATRAPIETSVLRTPGIMYRELPDGYFRNLYNLRVVNKTYNEQEIRLELIQPGNGRLIMVGDLEIPADDLGQSAFFIDLPPQTVTGVKTPIVIEVYSNDKLLERVRTSFIGPDRREN